MGFVKCLRQNHEFFRKGGVINRYIENAFNAKCTLGYTNADLKLTALYREIRNNFKSHLIECSDRGIDEYLKMRFEVSQYFNPIGYYDEK